MYGSSELEHCVYQKSLMVTDAAASIFSYATFQVEKA